MARRVRGRRLDLPVDSMVLGGRRGVIVSLLGEF